MKIACLADLHGHLPKVPEELTAGDVLIIAGDICLFGPSLSQMSQAMEQKRQWLAFQKWVAGIWDTRGIYIVGVAGNHDFALQQVPEMPYKFKWIYLEDRAWEHEASGLIFYGTPWQPWMGGWAFNAPEDELDDPNEPFLDEKFQQIPGAADVVIAHTPPAGFHDKVKGAHRGSIALNKHIERVDPKLVVYGHIHQPGVEQVGRTTLCNAAYVGFDRRPNNHPIQIFEI